MTDWKFAQRETTDQLALLHHFTMVKQQGDAQIEFSITVREYVSPKDPSMPFFAQADKQTNQKTAPFTPCGWGRSVLEALSTCMESIRRFPYEPQAERAADARQI